MTPEEQQVEDEAQEKIREAMRMAKEMNEILGDIIEKYKEDPSVIARTHAVILHSILRQSVCCLPMLAAQVTGVWSRLERELMMDDTWGQPLAEKPKGFGGH